jgi:hypothetical protein
MENLSIEGLEKMIEDAERRIGSFVASGCDMDKPYIGLDDPYIKKQIEIIKAATARMNDLIDQKEEN